MAEAIAVLKERGAVVVDPANIPSVVDANPERNFLRWEVCRGTEGPKGKDAHCSVVFKYGMKRDFSKWLASLGPAAPVKTLGELRNWNLARRNAGTLKFSQSQLDNSDEMDVEADRARYLADRAKDIELSGPSGIDAVCEPSGSTRCSSRWTPARSCPRGRGIRRSSCHSRWSRTPRRHRSRRDSRRGRCRSG
jgi:amidase